MNPFYQLSELEQYLADQEEPKCLACKGTKYTAIPGTQHIGPDGNIDYDIEKCRACNYVGVVE